MKRSQLPNWSPPDDPFLARQLKAGQGLVTMMMTMTISDDDDDDDDNDETSLDSVYANKVVEDTPGLDISGSNPSLAR